MLERVGRGKIDVGRDLTLRIPLPLGSTKTLRRRLPSAPSNRRRFIRTSLPSSKARYEANLCVAFLFSSNSHSHTHRFSTHRRNEGHFKEEHTKQDCSSSSPRRTTGSRSDTRFSFPDRSQVQVRLALLLPSLFHTPTQLTPSLSAPRQFPIPNRSLLRHRL